MTVSIVPLPAPAPGTQRALTVHRYGRPGSRPKAYLQAALHADEIPGLLVLHHLLALLEKATAADQVRGEIVIVPVANPIGLAQQLNGALVGRFDFGASGNFNRNFPALPDDAMLVRLQGQLGSNPDANVALIRQVLVQTLAQQTPVREVDVLKNKLLSLSIDADLVLDLHCDLDAVLHLYAPNCHQDKAFELGAELGTRAILLETEPGGGAFDNANSGPWRHLSQHLGEGATIPLACFAATVELRGQAQVDDNLARQDAFHLYRFLQRQGVIDGDPGPLPAAQCAPTPLQGVDIIKAPSTGIVAYHKTPGDWVQKDEIIADLIDPLSAAAEHTRTPLRSATEGILLSRALIKLVTPGQSVGKVAGKELLAHRRSGHLLED